MGAKRSRKAGGRHAGPGLPNVRRLAAHVAGTRRERSRPRRWRPGAFELNASSQGVGRARDDAVHDGQLQSQLNGTAQQESAVSPHDILFFRAGPGRVLEGFTEPPSTTRRARLVDKTSDDLPIAAPRYVLALEPDAAAEHRHVRAG